jgi:hypothetical protein
MWTTMAFVTFLVLAPGQAGQLTLANPRMTYGILGPTRTDNKFLPGDSLVLAFDIQGIKTDSAGKVAYGIGLEVTDAAGKSVFKQAPRDREANNSLGGNSLPGFASVQIGTEQPAGSYVLKVTVTDRSTKASQTLTHPYQVLPKGFGLVRLYASQDPQGRYPAPFVGDGEELWISFSAVGFGRDANGQPNLNVSLRLIDENGQPTLAQPYTGEVNKDVPANALEIPMQFLLELNRSGKFTIEIKATDNVAKKTAALSVPLNVQKAK